MGANEIGNKIPIIIDVIEINSFLDGGTVKYVDDKNVNYYIDWRIGSSSLGLIFDRYPGLDGSGVLENYKLNVVKTFL